ncbi:sugar kinase [Haliangium sp.]|uniref:sugar kinase n=1 Tax=Haliangium sp. TaxID=2663208 RepID=UPI003D12A783
MPDIIALGEPLLEFNQVRGPDGSEQYLPGFGGDTSNFAVAAARQGASVGYCTRLGRDGFGDAFMELWAREGVDTSLVERDPEAPTAIYFVTHDDDGHAFTYFRKGSAASRMSPGALPMGAIGQAQVLHLSGITQAISASSCDAAFAAIEAARAGGAKVSYDPNLRLKLWELGRARAIINETAGLADMCLPSLDEGRLLSEREQPDDIVDFYLDRGAGLVALKMGAEGVLVADGEQRHRVPGLTVECVDATGAGDTFDGAFVAMLVGGHDLARAARYANAAAALTTTGHGAVLPIPHGDAVRALLQRTQ